MPGPQAPVLARRHTPVASSNTPLDIRPLDIRPLDIIPLEIRSGRDAITLVSATPGRMRLRLLQFLAIALLMLPFVGCMVFPLFAVPDSPALGQGLRMLLGAWQTWALCAVFVLLFVLDGRSRLKTVWGAARVRSSWLFGPLELFVVERTRQEMGPPVIVERRVGRGLSAILAGTRSGWSVGWLASRGRDRPPELIELARVAGREQAEDLVRTLQAWREPAHGAVTRAPLDAGSVAADLASGGVSWLIRLPLAMLAGFCLALVGLALESFAIEQGKAPAVLPWNAVATADLTRLHWRLSRRPVETRSGGKRVRYDSVASELQAAVRFVDARGATREHPLALRAPEGGGFANGHGGPAGMIEQAGMGGLRFEPVQFEVPRDLLDVPVDAEGRMRFAAVHSQPDAEILTTPWHLHWAGLTGIDRPSVYLPLSWSEPSLGPQVEIVYALDADASAPVWLRSQAVALEHRLASFDDAAYVLGIFGFVVGGLACYWLAPRRWRGWALPLWVFAGLASIGTMPIADSVSQWVGVDRGLQVRIRDTLARALILPGAAPPRAVDASVAVGRWSPEGSRHALLLRHLGLADPPPQRHPDFASARAAIEQVAHARLAVMDATARADFVDALGDVGALQRGGNAWLVEKVIAPGVCAWREDGISPPSEHARYTALFDCPARATPRDP